MFLGHFGVAMAARSGVPRASLGTYFAACQLPDLIWPVLLLLGIERVKIVPGITAASPLDFECFPYTHSLLMSVAQSALVTLGYRWVRGDGRTALWLGGTVFSHWVLDWITHRPDLQLAPWSATRFGLGLWNHPLATMITEGGMFAAGAWLYLAATRAKDRIGSIGLFAFCATLVILFAASSTGPPPPNTTVLAIVALAMWLFLPWAYWIDRHREARPLGAASHG